MTRMFFDEFAFAPNMADEMRRMATPYIAVDASTKPAVAILSLHYPTGRIEIVEERILGT